MVYWSTRCAQNPPYKTCGASTTRRRKSITQSGGKPARCPGRSRNGRQKFGWKNVRRTPEISCVLSRDGLLWTGSNGILSRVAGEAADSGQRGCCGFFSNPCKIFSGFRAVTFVLVTRSKIQGYLATQRRQQNSVLIGLVTILCRLRETVPTVL